MYNAPRPAVHQVLNLTLPSTLREMPLQSKVSSIIPYRSSLQIYVAALRGS